MTTDMTLSSPEIVKLYGIRWDIEPFFKVSKSLLKLSKETQTRNFNGLICHTTVVFIRYIVLSWQQRCATDTRTLGGLFYELCDEMNELDWVVALSSLVSLLVELTQTLNQSITPFFSLQVMDWFNALPSYIKGYLPNLVCES